MFFYDIHTLTAPSVRAIISTMKNLILVDDHKMLRKGIASYITENSDWKVGAEAENLADVKKITDSLYSCTPPHENSAEENITVAVVDLQLKGSEDEKFGGFEAVKELAAAGVPSIIFTSHDTGACIEQAMSAGVGAKGFVSKLSDEKMLLDAINAVAKGKTFIQPDLVTSFIETRSLLSMLTKRETQVVRLLQENLSNEEIADKMGIKITTLENYLSIIYDKTGCRDKKTLIEKLR